MQTLQLHTERKLIIFKFYCWAEESEREIFSEQSIFWLKRPKFKHLLYLVQIAGTIYKPECLINLLCNVTCSLRPDLVNGFVRLELYICKSHINFSLEMFKGTRATWSFVLAFCIGASSLCSMECKCIRCLFFLRCCQTLLLFILSLK